MGLLERLKELSSKATKEPWLACVDPSITTKEAFLKALGNVWEITQEHGGSVKDFFVVQDESKEINIAIIGNGPKGSINVSMIAESRNSIDTLIKVIEIQREALEFLVSKHDLTFAECSDAEMIWGKANEAIQTTSKLLGESDE